MGIWLFFKQEPLQQRCIWISLLPPTNFLIIGKGVLAVQQTLALHSLMHGKWFTIHSPNYRHACKAMHTPQYVHTKTRGGQKLETYKGLEELMPREKSIWNLTLTVGGGQRGGGVPWAVAGARRRSSGEICVPVCFRVWLSEVWLSESCEKPRELWRAMSLTVQRRSNRA